MRGKIEISEIFFFPRTWRMFLGKKVLWPKNDRIEHLHGHTYLDQLRILKDDLLSDL